MLIQNSMATAGIWLKVFFSSGIAAMNLLQVKVRHRRSWLHQILVTAASPHSTSRRRSLYTVQGKRHQKCATSGPRNAEDLLVICHHASLVFIEHHMRDPLLWGQDCNVCLNGPAPFALSLRAIQPTSIWEADYTPQKLGCGSVLEPDG